MCSIYVRGFDFNVREEDLDAHFSTAGRVVNVSFIKRKGHAIVTFGSEEEAATAVESLNRSYMPGSKRYIECELWRGGGKGDGRHYDSGSGGGKGPGGYYDSGVGGGGGGGGYPRDGHPREGAHEALTVDEFIEANGLDFRASQALLSQPEEVQRAVIEGGRFGSNVRNPSAAMFTRIDQARKKIDSGEQYSSGAGGQYSSGAAERYSSGAAERYSSGGSRQQRLRTPPRDAGGDRSPRPSDGAAPGVFRSGAVAGGAVPAAGRPSSAAPVAPTQAKRKMYLSSGVLGQSDPKRSRPGGKRDQGHNLPPWAPGSDGRRVFIRGFDFGTSEDAIKFHCERVGIVKNLSILTPGSALVEFETEVDAQEAMEHLEGTVIDGNTRYIEVKLDDAVTTLGGDGGGGELERGGYGDRGDYGDQSNVMKEPSDWHGDPAGGEVDEIALVQELVAAEDANAEWKATLALAWKQFCMVQPTGRSMGTFFAGLPDDAKAELKVGRGR